MSNIDIDKLKRFESRLGAYIKQMLSDGWYPGTFLFPLGKINGMMQISEELDFPLKFERDIYVRTAFKLRNIPLFKNYKFLVTLNKISQLKRYFKRYIIMDGHKFDVHPSSKMMDIVNDYIAVKAKGITWEPETTRLVKELVKPGMTCVDVGASVGYFTLLFSRCVGPTGRVVSIEPTDFQQPYRKNNVRKNGYKDRVELVHCGAWDKDEVVKMPRNAPPYVQTELRCRPVDDILEELGIFKIDFIKIDVDGPEPKVLKGLIRTFERSPGMRMVIEYYPKYIEDAGLDPKDFMETLNKYFTYEVIPDDYDGNCWNYICIRR